jgi:hypothetical protein
MEKENMSDTEKQGCPQGKHPSLLMAPRFQQGPITTAMQLGPLASLAGSWKGSGFNAIWRPDNPESQPGTQTKRFLELNLTSESLDFHVIPGVVPNRGLNPQTDLSLYGLHYLQRVTDADPPGFSTAGQALHLEPGLFMNVPASVDPPNPASIVRLASIPHGVAVLMQGPNPGTTPTPGPPNIPPIYPIAGLPPFAPPAGALGLGIQPVDIPPPAGDGAEHIVPEVDIANDIAGSQSNGPYPPSFQGFINDPNSMLRAAIADQDILGTIAINLSTTGVGSGIENIPFLGIANPFDADNPTGPANAFVSSAAATFWIEWVRVPREVLTHGGPGPKPEGIDARILGIEPFWPEETYLQLQYSQVVILIFNGVLWPHVTVATLTLSAG